MGLFRIGTAIGTWAATKSKKIGETFNKAKAAIQKRVGKKEPSKIEQKKVEGIEKQPTKAAKSQEKPQAEASVTSREKVREKAQEFKNKNKQSFPVEETNEIQTQPGGKPSDNTNSRYRAKGWDDSYYQSQDNSQDRGMEI